MPRGIPRNGVRHKRNSASVPIPILKHWLMIEMKHIAKKKGIPVESLVCSVLASFVTKETKKIGLT